MAVRLQNNQNLITKCNELMIFIKYYDLDFYLGREISNKLRNHKNLKYFLFEKYQKTKLNNFLFFLNKRKIKVN